MRRGLVAGQHLRRDALIDQPLDAAQQADFVRRHQRDGLAVAPGPAGTADAVHVIVRHVRQVVVDHQRQLVDVDAAGGDVGCHQHAYIAVLETFQRPRAGTLALVAVNGGAFQTVRIELLGQAVGTVLGAGKHQHLLPVVAADQPGQQLALAALVDGVGHLRDLADGRVARRDVDFHRLVQELRRQRTDVARERGREQQRLPLFGQQGKNPANVADEAHVQHAVGLVQYQDFDPVQNAVALLQVIQQAAGCGHQHVKTARQGIGLRIDANAAENHGAAQAKPAAVILDVLPDLGRQLASRGQHQCADRSGPRRLLAGRQALQHRQRKTGGLAGAGLGRGQHVLAGQNDRDGLLLNGRRGVIAVRRHGTTQLGAQAESRKRHTDS